MGVVGSFRQADVHRITRIKQDKSWPERMFVMPLSNNVPVCDVSPLCALIAWLICGWSHPSSV